VKSLRPIFVLFVPFFLMGNTSFRHLLSPELDGLLLKKKAESVVASEGVVDVWSSEKRWGLHLHWLNLSEELRVKGEALSSSRQCVSALNSLKILQELIQAESSFFLHHCLNHEEQSSFCLASPLRFEEIQRSVESFNLNMKFCEKPAEIEKNEFRGSLSSRLAIEGYRLEVSKNITRLYSEIPFQTKLRHSITSRYQVEANLLGRIGTKSETHFHDFRGDVNNLFRFNQAALSGNFGFFSKNGRFSLSQSLNNYLYAYYFSINSQMPIAESRATFEYRAEKQTSSEKMYSANIHKFALSFDRSNLKKISYELNVDFFQRFEAAVLPSSSSTRLLLDFSNLFANTVLRKKTLKVGLSESRNEFREVFLSPQVEYLESFGPFHGLAWLVGSTNADAMFDSRFMFDLKTEETEYSSANRKVDVGGELRWLRERFVLPLRLNVEWNRALSRKRAPDESLGYQVGLYPEWRLNTQPSRQWNLIAFAEYRQKVFFDKMTLDDRLWVFPYETFDRYFAGLMLRYDYE